jgi:hypothetical protein
MGSLYHKLGLFSIIYTNFGHQCFYYVDMYELGPFSEVTAKHTTNGNPLPDEVGFCFGHRIQTGIGAHLTSCQTAQGVKRWGQKLSLISL